MIGQLRRGGRFRRALLVGALATNAGALVTSANLSVAEAAPVPAATVYGAPGTFHGLTDEYTTTGTGHLVRTAGVDSWQWPQGAAAYFPELTGDGRVVMGTNFQHQDSRSTKQTMDAAVFNPNSNPPALTKVPIKSRTVDGTTEVSTSTSGHSPANVYPARWSPDGGADFGDVCTTGRGTAAERVVGPTSISYSGHIGAGSVFRLDTPDQIGSFQINVTVNGVTRTTTMANWVAMAQVVEDRLVATGHFVAGEVGVTKAFGKVDDPATPGVDESKAAEYLVTLRGAKGSTAGLTVTNLNNGRGTAAKYDGDGRGVFPSLVSLDTTGGGARVDKALTANALAAKNGGANSPDFPQEVFPNAFAEGGAGTVDVPLHKTIMLGECDPIGTTGDVVVGQYGAGADPTGQAGKVLIFGPDGTLKASKKPTVANHPICNCPVNLYPRNIGASKSDRQGNYYISVIYDTVWPGTKPTSPAGLPDAPPFALQVFKWKPGTSSLTEATGLLLPPKTSTGRNARFNMAVFNDTGTLFAVASENENGGNLPHASWLIALNTGTCRYGNFKVGQWSTVGSSCPTQDIYEPGWVVSSGLNYDEERKTIHVVSANAHLRSFGWNGSAFAAPTKVDLGLAKLRNDPSGAVYNLQIRKGVIDAARDRLYLVVQGNINDMAPQQAVPQFLYSVDLNRIAQPATSPTGSITSAAQAAGGDTGGAVRLTGTALDHDATDPVELQVRVNGGAPVAYRADTPVSGFGAQNPGYGDNHGFDITLTGLAYAQPHEVCITAENVFAGSDQLLGCTTVTPTGPNPIGEWKTIAQAPNTGTAPNNRAIRLTGTAHDFDQREPTHVAVFIGARSYRFLADRVVPGYGTTYPNYDDNHGFDVVATGLPTGTHKVCVYAANVHQGGAVALKAPGVTTICRDITLT